MSCALLAKLRTLTLIVFDKMKESFVFRAPPI
jgi:hypothetical protein